MRRRHGGRRDEKTTCKKRRERETKAFLGVAGVEVLVLGVLYKAGIGAMVLGQCSEMESGPRIAATLAAATMCVC